MSPSTSVIKVTTDQELAASLKKAGPGTTIELSPAVYRQPLILDRNGEQGNPIRIVAAEPGTVVLSGADPVSDWRDEGDGRWSTPFEITARQNLQEHFGFITLPCQVWIDDRWLQPVGNLRRLVDGTFAHEDGRLWLQLEKGVDPRVRNTEVAVRETMLSANGTHLEFKGLHLTRCANSIQIEAARFSGSHLLVEDCEFSETAAGRGAYFNADDAVIRRNHIHHNGQMGFGLVASCVLFEDNTVADNDLRGFVCHPEAEWHVWECGGGKVAYARDCVFRRNRFSNNIGGPGLWFDIDNYRNRIEANTFSNNGHSAIMIEISRDNIICNNVICDTRESSYSAAAILVQLSCRTRIYHNLLLRSEGYGVHLRWHVRNRDIHPYEPADPDAFEQEHGFRQEDWMDPDAQYPVAGNDIRNNIFVDCRRGAIQIDQHPEHVYDNTSDYNFFWNAHNFHPMSGGHRLLEWQEMTGLDGHSFYEKDMHYGPLLIEGEGMEIRVAPDGPLAELKVPRIDEVVTNHKGESRGEATTPGPF
jgi:hypothetical protein